MKFRHVAAMNFRSLSDVQLDLRRPPGLYFMTGRNLDRPKLGANGIGKSSIWQALRWGLYGTTSDGIRAEALRGKREGSGYDAEIQVGKKRLTRTWQPNGMDIDGRTVSTFCKVVPLTAAEFDACVLACQDGMTILDYTPTQRLELLSSVLHLDRWNELSKSAQDLTNRRHVDLQTTVYAIGRANAAIDELKKMDLNKQVEEFETEREKSIAILKIRLRKLKVERDNLRVAFRRKTKAKTEQDGVVSVIEKSLADATPLYEKARKEREAIVEQMVRAQERATATKRLLKHIQHIHGTAHMEGSRAECDVCGSEMTPARRLARIKQLRGQMQEEEAKLDVWMQTLKKTDEELDRGARVLKEWQQKLDDVKDGAKEIGRDITELLFSIPRAEKAVEAARQSIQAERSRPNPIKETDDKRLAKIKARRAERADLRAKEQRQEKAVGRAQWWVAGFKDVRYYVLEEALAELTAVTQANMISLGMSDYSLEYVAEKEAKSGAVSRTFDVRVKGPFRRDYVPLQTLSAGERQRLRLAASFSVSDFLLRRRSLMCNIEVYDEPTSHLSPEGIDSVVELLRLRAQQSQKQIWLVDHHAIQSTAFAGTVVLELKKGRTSIVQ